MKMSLVGNILENIQTYIHSIQNGIELPKADVRFGSAKTT